MLDPLNLLEVFSFQAVERLYADASGRRVVLDVEGQVMWGASRPGLVDVSREEGCLVLAAADDYAVTAWALHGEVPELDGGEAASRSVSGPCWLSCVAGLTEIDGHATEQVDVPFAPVFFNAKFQSARVHRTGQTLRLVADLSPFSPEWSREAAGEVRSASRPASLTSTNDVGRTITGDHLAHLGPASFELESRGGVILGKLYDRFHGIQRAHVSVDGSPTGVWQAMGADRSARWATSTFGLGTLPAGRHRVTIVPLPGTALWDVSRYLAWELNPSPRR